MSQIDPIIVPESLAQERIDRALALITGWSRTDIQDLLKAEKIFVNEKLVNKSYRLTPHDRIDIISSPPLPPPLGPEAVDIEVRYFDEDVIVVAKPAGLVVHPGTGNEHGTLVHGLLQEFPEIAEVGESGRPGIVHRLDRDTSGLMVVARSTAAYVELVDALGERKVTRKYVALVEGVPEARRGVIDAPIGRSTRSRTRMAVRDSGRPARTHYEVEKIWLDPHVSLLAVRLESGRTHQIRVHFSAISHPVVGDGTYGSSEKSSRIISRPFLHAAELSFSHPVSGEPLNFTEPLTPDLIRALEALGPAQDSV
ncbi:putative RNA pseudouridine synthase [Actinomycetes bacterium]|nr:putative RNA pseudouridine synthase [Actinomycetes bacterium]